MRYNQSIMKNISSALWTVFIITGCALLIAPYAPSRQHPPKNIILLIGDGMGLSQVTAAKVTKGTLEMERFPIIGLVTTWSANELVTDSAAAATALATGRKTNNGMISVDPNGVSLRTAAEAAEENGKSTGLVCACALTHATPAGFAAHVFKRSQYEEIAFWLALSDLDVLFGGGYDHFNSTNYPSLSLLQSKMTVATNTAAFRELGTPAKAAALLYPVHPPLAAEREVPLKELTQKALEILSQNEDGFFLMVEGSQIDWMGHQNNAGGLVSEVADFDEAVGAALDFAEIDEDTLVIVTADHETGGYAIIDGSLAAQAVSKAGFVHKKHTGTMVPLFAYGPGSERFQGVMDNTDIAKHFFSFIQPK